MKRLTLFVVLVLCLPIQSFVEATELNSSSTEIDITDCEILSGFYDLWRISFFGREPNRVEAGAWILLDESGEYEFLRWEITPQREKVSWNGPMPPNKIAQAHTHPQAVDPRPSGTDRMIAAQLRIPIYTISRRGIWKAMPDGSVSQLADHQWHKRLKFTACE